MKHQSPSSLRNILITLTTTAAAFAVSVGLPMKKTLASPAGVSAASSSNMATGPAAGTPPGNGKPDVGHVPVKRHSDGPPLGISLDPSSLLSSVEDPRPAVVQEVQVNPTAVRLVKIAGEAMTDAGLAERIIGDPDAVAAKYGLSPNETKVLHQMTREQFQTAREDAAHVAAARLAEAGDNTGTPTPTEINTIAGRMVVGRSILAAVGRSYLDAADAHACCPWNKAIQLGVNSDPAMYASVFAR